MNRKFVVSVAAMLLVVSLASWAADDGATLYKKKWAGCHGANGEGKPAIKAPALKETSLGANQIAEHITKSESGSKHRTTKASPAE